MTTAPLDPWTAVIGQDEAVRVLRTASSAPVHAYLFVGPPGAGKRAAARAFAGDLLAEGLDGADRARVLALAAEGHHADLVEIEPDGTVFRFPAARDGDSPGLRLVREATTSPRESARKVVVAVDFHLARDEAVGKLLKVIEEPPPSTVVILLETDVPPEQVTIASRCARVDFGPVPAEALMAYLISTLGLDRARAELVAGMAGGDRHRADLLMNDEGALQRFDAWHAVPGQLDGTGATVARLVRELQAEVDQAQEAAKLVQEEELAQLDADAEARGTTRGSGKRELVEAHKRALRNIRTAELRFGLATIAAPYRERLATTERPAELCASLDALQDAAEALERNPIEGLLLEATLLRLAPLSRI